MEPMAMVMAPVQPLRVGMAQWLGEPVAELLLGTLQYLLTAVCAASLLAVLLLALGKSQAMWLFLCREQPAGYCTKVNPSDKVVTLADLDISDRQKNQDVVAPRLENPLPTFTRLLLKVLPLQRFIKDEKDLPLLEILISTNLLLVLNVLPNLFLDPLMGIPPLVFLLHHPIMHHIGNNHDEGDISSTETYQRDSWVAFVRYWWRFQVGAYWELPCYALRAGRPGWCVACVSVIGAFLVALQALVLFSGIPNVGYATIAVFGIPWIYDHATDAARNWCQHMFVIPAESDKAGDTFFHHNCGLTYNIIDDVHNRETYNEGYHVIHHTAGGLHWSSMPDSFYEHVDKLKVCDSDVWCLTFRNTSIEEVFLHTASGKLDVLVKNHYIHIPTAARPDPPTVGEVGEELMRRCAPVDTEKARDSKFSRFQGRARGDAASMQASTAPSRSSSKARRRKIEHQAGDATTGTKSRDCCALFDVSLLN